MSISQISYEMRVLAAFGLNQAFTGSTVNTPPPDASNLSPMAQLFSSATAHDLRVPVPPGGGSGPSPVSGGMGGSGGTGGTSGPGPSPGPDPTPIPQYETVTTPNGNTIAYQQFDPNGPAAAQDLKSSFDVDNNTIASWFNASPINGMGIVLDPSQGNGASHVSGSNTMRVGDTTWPLTGQDTAPSLAAAEQVENYETQAGNGWQPGQTNGEALSRLGMLQLHPESYWYAQTSDNIWLKDYGKSWASGNTSQGNFITNNSAPDSNWDGSGQGLLFLQWMETQKGQNGQPITLNEIAQAGGNNLGETYSKLTGKTASYGVQQFASSLNTLPTDSSGNLTTSGTYYANPFLNPDGTPRSAPSSTPAGSAAPPAAAANRQGSSGSGSTTGNPTSPAGGPKVRGPS